MTRGKKTDYDVIVIGAGAAGLMCATEAARRGRKVSVLEHNDRIGKKIRISGGGRCNFTNIHSGPEKFLSQNPHFCKSALARYTPRDICALLDKHGVTYHEKKEGQLFCNKSAQDVIDVLDKECADLGVSVSLNTRIESVNKANQFHVETNHGEYEGKSLVIATGGLSIPPLGATDFGYGIARQFGLNIVSTKPGLAPFLFGDDELKVFWEIAGVSIPVTVKLKNISFKENILFTHKGLSGPAILQISSYWKSGENIAIDLLPDINIAEIFEKEFKNRMEMKNIVGRYLPQRFCERLFAVYIPNKPMNRYWGSSLEDAAQALHRWVIKPKGTEGYAKAEVTVGGVDTDELSSKTMETKKVKGLYFIGEVVDITGHLGGHNFQWAWASGYAAGQVV